MVHKTSTNEDILNKYKGPNWMRLNLLILIFLFLQYCQDKKIIGYFCLTNSDIL